MHRATARADDEVAMDIIEHPLPLLNGGSGRSTRLPCLNEEREEGGVETARSNGGSSTGSYHRLSSPVSSSSSPKRFVEMAFKTSSTSPLRSSPLRKPPPAAAAATLRTVAPSSSSSDSSSDDEEDRHPRGGGIGAAAAAVAFARLAKRGRKAAAARADGAVLKAPTNFNRLKSKSRLADPPPPPTIYQSEPSGNPNPPYPTRSPAVSAAVNPTEDEDDPLATAHDDDLPEEYRRRHIGWGTIFQLCSLLLLGAFLPCSLVLAPFKNRSLWSLHLWKWALLGIIVLSGELLSEWFINIIVFFIERNFMWRKRVLYFVYGLRRGVQTVLWLTLCFIAWMLLVDPKVQRSTNNHKALGYVTKVLICCLIAAFVWLAKLLFVKVVASSYHVSTYFDRIQDSLFHQYILEKLSGPPLEESGGDGNIDGNGIQKNAKNQNNISWDKLQLMNQMNVSAWNMKKLITVVKQTGIATFSETIDSNAGFECKESEIQTEQQARTAAKLIFKNVAKPGRKYILLEDLLRFLTDSEANKALSLFEGATEFGKITKKGLVNWVTNVYRERRSLALSLNDTKTAVNKLHQVINGVVIIIISIISLLVLGLATSQMLVVASSQLLLIVFIFGNTAKTIFEAIIFLFVMHPYDVGDRCVVDGVQMVVEEMNILTTVFLRYDNEKIYYPNSVLASKPISNFYRSPDMGDAIDFSVHITTPVEKLATLKSKIARYIETHSHHWHSKFNMVVKDIEDLNSIKISLWPQHTMNFQNAGERWSRRSELLMNLKTYCQDLGIEYRLLSQDVSISKMPGSPRVV